MEITVIGDVVNTTARLASAAESGEVLVSVDAARAAGLDDTALEHRSLELKGKEAPTEVVSVRIGSAISDDVRRRRRCLRGLHGPILAAASRSRSRTSPGLRPVSERSTSAAGRAS